MTSCDGLHRGAGGRTYHDSGAKPPAAEPIDYDWVLYRERNIVERSIGWLKQGRRIATRYEKTAASYLGFVLFAAKQQAFANPQSG